MTSLSLPLRFIGPDRYCPTCGRLLVKVHENGTFNLSGQASLEAAGEMTVENGVPIDDTIETLVVEAICLICEPERDPGK